MEHNMWEIEIDCTKKSNITNELQQAIIMKHNTKAANCGKWTDVVNPLKRTPDEWNQNILYWNEWIKLNLARMDRIQTSLLAINWIKWN